MEMRGVRMLGKLGLCGLMVVGLACNKGAKDTSKVLANVGGEKITEKSFSDAVHALVGDDARAKDLLTNPALKDQRNQFLAELVDQKVMGKYGDKQGLDKDPKVKLLADAAKVNAYGQVLMERLLPKGEPTEAQMKAFYDDAKVKAHAAGQDKDFPPFEAVKAQIAPAIKRQQSQEASMTLLKEAKAQVSSTIDPEWRSAQQAQ